MVFVIIVLLILIFSKAAYAKKGEFHSDYIDKNATTAINGVFVILVFLRHFAQYCDLTSSSDLPFLDLNGYLNQLIVVPFLFFSGFGIMTSIMKKGTPYVKNIFAGRFLKILLHFDICVLLFLLADIALKKQYSLKDTLLAFTTWTSIGNSNWYITAVLALYLITMISFLIIRKHNLFALILFTVLTVAFVYFNMKIDRPDYCYNTMIVYPLGMWFAYLKPYFDKLVMKNNITYALALSIITACFAFSYKHCFESIECYALWASAFAILIVLILMKIKINNQILTFFGEHVFSIYILQRLPMMIFNSMGIGSNPFNLFILSFAVTILIALIFDELIKKLDAVVFKSKKQHI